MRRRRARRAGRNPLLMTVGALGPVAGLNPGLRAVPAERGAKARLEDWLRDFVRRSRPGTVNEALRIRRYVSGTIERKGLDARRVWGNPRGAAAREVDRLARLEAYEAAYGVPTRRVKSSAARALRGAGFGSGAAGRAWQSLRAKPPAFTPAEVRRSLPNRGARRNPERSGLVRSYGATLDQVRGAPGFAEAVAGFRRFHGGEPTRALVAEYDDGRPEVREEVLYALGPAQIELDQVEGADGRPVRIKRLKVGTVYSVPEGWQSNKAGKQWIHSHEEGGGKPPIHAVDPRTGILQQLAGTYYVGEWIER